MLKGAHYDRKDIEKVLISKEEILAKAAELGKQLTEEYQGKNPLVVGILKGAVPFMADLTREINTYLELDFMDVSSTATRQFLQAK